MSPALAGGCLTTEPPGKPEVTLEKPCLSSQARSGPASLSFRSLILWEDVHPTLFLEPGKFQGWATRGHVRDASQGRDGRTFSG